MGKVRSKGDRKKCWAGRKGNSQVADGVKCVFSSLPTSCLPDWRRDSWPCHLAWHSLDRSVLFYEAGSQCNPTGLLGEAERVAGAQ